MSDKIIGNITFNNSIQGNIDNNSSIQGNVSDENLNEGQVVVLNNSIEGNVSTENSAEGQFNAPSYTVIRDKNYLHTQNEASNVWIITHNLNKYPSVSIVNSAGDEVMGDVHYDSLNQVTLTFEGAFKGQATLN